MAKLSYHLLSIRVPWSIHSLQYDGRSRMDAVSFLLLNIDFQVLCKLFSFSCTVMQLVHFAHYTITVRCTVGALHG